MKLTKSLKTAEISRNWYLVDATNQPIGKVSNLAARLLIGKHKATYTPHIDNGDYVIVINTDKVKASGNKPQQKTYYRHSGHPGSLKKETLAKLMERDSTLVVSRAVKGMLPKNKLQAPRLSRLKLFKDDKHSHEPQQPIKWEEKRDA